MDQSEFIVALIAYWEVYTYQAQMYFWSTLVFYYNKANS